MDHRTPPPRSASLTAPEAPRADAGPDLTGVTLGDFHVLRRLGQGGMGQVYLAEQISLKRKVALKLLRADLAANITSLQRFKAEAEAVARATHANIVQVYFIGETSGLHYMALEYVEGRNLREFLEKKGSPTLMVALSIMSQVAAALQRASELGIIHRDIKPENILLTRNGEVKVTDFGLSRCFAENTQPLNLTQSGVTMGTPLYMSPEQVEGKPVDPRTDIYSFGATCYQLFAGQPPFTGQSPFEVANQHVNKEPRPLAETRPDLPPELCALIHKMMAKKPEARFQTGREIVRELGRIRNHLLGVSTETSSISMGPMPSEPFDAVSTQVLPMPRRTPWSFLGALSLLLALAVGLGIGWWRNRPSPPILGPVANGVPNPAKELFSAKEREKDLVKRWQEHPKQDLDVVKRGYGLSIAMDLSLLYLKEKRWEEADKFFKDLERIDSGKLKQLPSYLPLSRLGQGMVLAFQDKPDLSNEKFLPILKAAETKPAAKSSYWLNNPEICEMIAKALHHNYVNAGNSIPPALEKWLHPPVPKGPAPKN